MWGQRLVLADLPRPHVGQSLPRTRVARVSWAAHVFRPIADFKCVSLSLVGSLVFFSLVAGFNRILTHQRAQQLS